MTETLEMISARNGELVVLSATRRLVGSRYHADQVGRAISLGLAAGVPTLIPAEMGGAQTAEDLARQTATIAITTEREGVIPPTFGAHDEQAAYVWMHGHRPLPSRESRIGSLENSSGLPKTAAAVALELVERGLPEQDVIEALREEYETAIREQRMHKFDWGKCAYRVFLRTAPIKEDQ